MHELLAVEEVSMFQALSKYNVEVELELAEKFLILPAGFSSVKQAPEGTLFARMTLADSYLELSEDTAAGRWVAGGFLVSSFLCVGGFACVFLSLFLSLSLSVFISFSFFLSFFPFYFFLILSLLFLSHSFSF